MNIETAQRVLDRALAKAGRPNLSDGQRRACQREVERARSELRLVEDRAAAKLERQGYTVGRRR
jgi:hypothetical protein